jgi:hypothetical protein
LSISGQNLYKFSLKHDGSGLRKVSLLLPDLPPIAWKSKRERKSYGSIEAISPLLFSRPRSSCPVVTMPAPSPSSSQPTIPAEQLVPLAKAGDPQAISKLLAQHFNNRDLQVQAEREEDHLYLWMAGQQLPEQTQLVPWLQKNFQQLHPEQIHTVTIQASHQVAESSLKREQRVSDWSVTFVLHEAALPTPTPEATDRDSDLAKPEHLQQAKELLGRYGSGERQFMGMDFSHLRLQGQKLSMGDFRQVNFTGADLSKANLSYTDLGLVNFQNAQLAGTDFLNANLQGANLQGANLQGANLAWCNLRGANLLDANIQGANLREANLTLATLPDGTLLE